MEVAEVIKEMELNNYSGVQLTKRLGILSTTWLLYKKSNFYFYFDINQEIEFIDRFRYTEKELIDEFKKSYFVIDFPIA